MMYPFRGISKHPPSSFPSPPPHPPLQLEESDGKPSTSRIPSCLSVRRTCNIPSVSEESRRLPLPPRRILLSISLSLSLFLPRKNLERISIESSSQTTQKEKELQTIRASRSAKQRCISHTVSYSIIHTFHQANSTCDSIIIPSLSLSISLSLSLSVRIQERPQNKTIIITLSLS